MGSGTTALACLQTRRTYIGSEISEAYITLANNRIRAITGDEEEWMELIILESNFLSTKKQNK